LSIEGGRRWCSRGSREAEVEEEADDEVGNEAAVHSEAGDEVAASSKAVDEATTCSGARIKDCRWQR
jgi:hypothetical protein